MVETIEQIQRKPPYLENIEKGILDSLFDPQYDDDGTFTGFGESGLLSSPKYTDPSSADYLFGVPDQNLAEIDPFQQKVFDTLSSQQYMDRFKPFFTSAGQYGKAGSEAFKSGLGFLDTAEDKFDTGETLVKSGIGQYDPSTQIKAFMDPYQENVIDVAMKRLGDIDAKEQQKAQAGAIGSGAFGGSRSRLNLGELQDAQADRRGDTLSKLLSQGYKTALGSSMDAYERAQRRDMEGGRLLGGLGSSIGRLGGIAGGIGQGYGGLGNVMGQLGQRYGGLTAGDLNALYSAGTSRQNYNQAVLDAYRSNQMNPLKGALMPLTLGQQFLKGTPSVGNVQQYTQTYQPSPNPFLQGLGLSFAYGQPQGQPQA